MLLLQVPFSSGLPTPANSHTPLRSIYKSNPLCAIADKFGDGLSGFTSHSAAITELFVIKPIANPQENVDRYFILGGKSLNKAVSSRW